MEEKKHGLKTCLVFPPLDHNPPLQTSTYLTFIKYLECQLDSSISTESVVAASSGRSSLSCSNILCTYRFLNDLPVVVIAHYSNNGWVFYLNDCGDIVSTKNTKQFSLLHRLKLHMYTDHRFVLSCNECSFV